MKMIPRDTLIPADPTYRRLALFLVTSPPDPPAGGLRRVLPWLREAWIGLLIGILATPFAFGIGLLIGIGGTWLGRQT